MSLREWIGLAGVSGVLAFSALFAAPAWATHTEFAADDAAAPRPICTIQDERLDELSGLAVGPQDWYAVNDGGERVEVFVLNEDCTVRDVITSATDPYDIEDMARGADGTLWLGDLGDNSTRRETVALHAVRPDGRSRLYRLTYPDRRHNAEALVLGGDGTPYIITKSVLGAAGVYRPADELASPGPTPLEKVGSVRIEGTDTPGGPVGSVGSTVVTAAALNRDATVLAVRTYTDVYLYPAQGGDVVAALRREPVRLPLAGERQGEAVAFTQEGTLLSAGEGIGEPIKAIPGAAEAVGAVGTPDPASGSDGRRDVTGEADRLPAVPALAVAVVLAGVAVFGVSRLRRRR